MSLGSALSTAMAGLRANQAALAIVSSNVANAQTPGYVSRSPNQVQINAGDASASVRVAGVNRQLDEYVQSQLRTEIAGGTYSEQISNILDQLQSVYGPPGEAGSLEASFTNFTAAVQSLSSSSGSQSAQVNALTAASTLAQSLNATSRGIQSLRSNVEQDISNSVNQANNAMQNIAALNRQLQSMQASDPAAAGLADQRDAAIDQLAQLMDVRVVIDNTNKATVYTNSGIQLVGEEASTLSFDGQGGLNPSSLWNSDPTKSGVGTLAIRLPNGSNIDMIANNSITSGRFAADLTLRDKTLVEAQAQIDQMAATLASAMSDKTTTGTAVTAGTKAGFDLDVSKVLPGNSINLTYTDTVTGAQRQISIVRVDDPSALPLPNTATANGNDTVIGVNFSGGMASIVSQLNTALGSTDLQFSNPSGSTLRVLDNGFGSTSINSASTTTTATALANGDKQLPLFMDGTSLYTGAFGSSGSQQLEFAARIAVNTALLADPAKLTVYNTSPATTAGDTTRSDFIFSQLSSANFTYSPKTGLGSVATPFKGTLASYMQQFLSQQSNAATSASQIKQGQDVVVSTLQAKFSSTASVNIDTEMANLIALQNTYAANAHVMSAVQSMMTTLMQVQT